jgi:hypothetical protein
MKNQEKKPKIKVSKRIELRVTEEFFQDLSLKIFESGLSQSEFLRQILSQGKVVVKKDYYFLAQQVRKVGVNVNEIAYSLNLSNLKKALNAYDYQALLVELKLIQNQLRRIGD